MLEIGVLGFGGENEVVEEVFCFRNKVYILSRCYFIILNIKFIIWCKLLEISNNYVITISYIYIYIYIYISKEYPLNSRKLLLI